VKHWAFRLQARHTVTGLLLDHRSWSDGMRFAATEDAAAARYRMARGAKSWQRIGDADIFDSIAESEVVAAMAEPGNGAAWQSALEHCATAATLDATAILLAAHGTRRRPIKPVRIREFRATPVVSMLEIAAGDPYEELIEFLAPIANGWSGDFGVDFADFQEVLTAGRVGWYARASGSGKKRAALAADRVLRQLNAIGARLDSAAGFLATIVTGDDVHLSETRTVMRKLASALPQARCRHYAHDTRPGDLQVQAMVLSCDRRRTPHAR
jgi:hypothetical protein